MLPENNQLLCNEIHFIDNYEAFVSNPLYIGIMLCDLSF